MANGGLLYNAGKNNSNIHSPLSSVLGLYQLLRATVKVKCTNIAC